jgi:hypothetical protein
MDWNMLAASTARLHLLSIVWYMYALGVGRWACWNP